jgi:hypothetical protein
MTAKKFMVRDETEKNSYVEFQCDAKKRSIMISIESKGSFVTVICDMAHFKRAVDEMIL